jgi:hypothetical protein
MDALRRLFHGLLRRPASDTATAGAVSSACQSGTCSRPARTCTAGREIRTGSDANVERVRAALSARSLAGFRKYGTTTERTDLSLLDWLQHLQEELLDAAVYVERLKEEARLSQLKQ